MERNLIVARMAPGNAGEVARLFAESDRTDLPRLSGVRRRTLYEFHGLYFHLVESDSELRANIDELRTHPLFQDISGKLAPHIDPYDPGWQGPTDALATPFYQWSADADARSGR